MGNLKTISERILQSSFCVTYKKVFFSLNEQTNDAMRLWMDKMNYSNVLSKIKSFWWFSTLNIAIQ